MSLMETSTHSGSAIADIDVPRLQIPPQAAVNDYPVRHNADNNRQPVVGPVRHEIPILPLSSLATLVEGQRSSAERFNLITLSGAACMFSTSTALTGNMAPSPFMDLCAVVGVIGTLFTGAAALLFVRGARRAATWMLLLSATCAATGAICMIAGTQSWEAIALTVACAMAALAIVVRAAMKGEKITDAEAFEQGRAGRVKEE